ncbi:hypothetical protein HOK51_01205 [Candidatus Woesearchaeota archaeon]|nr:hypothetical protein [Candidatus Woesearchaeota archaeon]MBT6518431.1 hypothetical protein [Candidatus Woesearchaeota archaeon]MBT7366599.1 hypothetical protein [Candidatus Woesearchaeota archaeon]
MNLTNSDINTLPDISASKDSSKKDNSNPYNSDTDTSNKNIPKISIYSKITRFFVKHTVARTKDKEKRKSYLTQIDDSSKNLEDLVKHFTKLSINNPLKTISFLAYIKKWSATYVDVQKKSDGIGHLIYTQHDHKIPFKPEYDIDYIKIIPQLIFCGKEIAKWYKKEELTQIIQAYLHSAKIAQDVFENHQTIMPRFKNHNRLSLGTVQKIDKPINCCPSMHITYSTLIYNLGKYILPREDFDDIKKNTKNMINSVLYTKQHALIDISFGILCAKISFEKFYPDYKFDDMTKNFSEMKKDHPTINYGLIKQVYVESLKKYDQENKKNNQENTFAKVVSNYLIKNKFPIVSKDDNLSKKYFNTKTNKIQTLTQ